MDIWGYSKCASFSSMSSRMLRTNETMAEKRWPNIGWTHGHLSLLLDRQKGWSQIWGFGAPGLWLCSQIKHSQIYRFPPKKSVWEKIWRHSETNSYTDMSMICMLPPTPGSFGWNRLLSYESCDTDELCSKNMEHGAIVALRVVMQTLQKDRLLLYLFNELLLFMMLYNLCADTTRTQKNAKKAFISPKNAERFGHMAKYDTAYLSYFTNLKRILQKTSLAAIIKPVSVEIGWQQTFPFLKQMEQIDGVQLINQSQRPWVLAFCLASLKLGRISSFSSRPGQPRWSVEGRRGRSRLPELTTHWETSVKFTAGWPNRMASPLANATWILKRNIQTSMTFQHPTFKKK